MIHHAIAQTERAKIRVQQGGLMRDFQLAVKYPGYKKEGSLLGSGIEDFQFLPVHLSADVPQTEISDFVARLCLLQQSSIIQNPHTLTSMHFADVDISTCRAGGTFKFPTQVPAVETQQCPISRMKPRRERQGVPVDPSWHTSYYTLPRYKQPSHRQFTHT